MLVTRAISRVEPSFLCNGTDPKFFLTDVPALDSYPLPLWMPQQVYIVGATASYGNVPGPSANGQLCIGVDFGRVCYGTAQDAAHQLGDNSRWLPLANLWRRPGMPMTDVRTFNPPIFVDRTKDSIWRQYTGCYDPISGGGYVQEMMFWELYIQYDDSTPDWPGFRPTIMPGRFMETLYGDSLGWGGLLLRQVIPVSSLGGAFSTIQVTLQPANAPSPPLDTVFWEINQVNLGHQATGGQPTDFASTPTPLTLNGARSFLIPGGQAFPLDAASFAYSGSGNLILEIATTSGGIRSKTGSAITRYYKAGIGDAGTLAPTGFDAGAANNLGIAGIMAS